MASGSSGSGEDPDAWERIGDPAARGPFVLTCEHACNRLPEWTPEPGDEPLLADHWGWDVGAADVTRALAEGSGSVAVLSRFSRLVCDPNRAPEEPSFVVEAVEGRTVSFNRGMDEAERERRRVRYWEPYHDAVDRTLAERLALGRVHLCSIHSFTPDHESGPRDMEVGVLFDSGEEHARRLETALAAEGFRTAQNEPYSGYAGMIYSARRHGRAHGVPYLELEIRQDLIARPDAARDVAARVGRALAVFVPQGSQAPSPAA